MLRVDAPMELNDEDATLMVAFQEAIAAPLNSFWTNTRYQLLILFTSLSIMPRRQRIWLRKFSENPSRPGNL